MEASHDQILENESINLVSPPGAPRNVTTADFEQDLREIARISNPRLQEHLHAGGPSRSKHTDNHHQNSDMGDPSVIEPLHADQESEDDELFVPQQELPPKRIRRTPLLTSREVSDSVRVGLDDTSKGKIPSSHRMKLVMNETRKGKGRKSKANDLDLATLGGSNIIEDVRANSQLPAIPTSTQGNKNDALKQLVNSLPEAARSDATPDKKAVIEATKKFNFKPRTDKQGGWKHPKLKTSLYHHQILGTAFMRERETKKQKPYGGMLCDVMGLGKTLQTLANIVDGESVKLDDNAETTLIVAPRSLANHWSSQIEKHVRQGVLGPILLYYAGSRIGGKYVVETMLMHKVIITTYDEVRTSFPKLERPDGMSMEEAQRWAENQFKEKAGPLHQIRFRRIILDEGHQIRNPESQTSIAIRALHAHYKWILSGTPLLNHNAEFWAYFNFLGVPHVGRFANFYKSYCSGDELANQRLANVVKSVVFRRTHRSRLFACPIITLPNIEEQTVVVKPLAIEKTLYTMLTDFFIDGINCMASNNDQEAQNRCFLTMILKLRMLNSHLLCVQDILKKMLTVDANLYQLKIAVPENAGDETDTNREIFTSICKLVSAGKRAKGDIESSHSRPLSRQFLDLIRTLMSNDNLEECQERMKCVGCEEISAEVYVTACMHLICDECLQTLRESNPLNDSKVVCPICMNKERVVTEGFSGNPGFLAIQLGMVGAKNREMGDKKKAKQKSSQSAKNNLFMKVFENADESGRAEIDWVKVAGEKIPSSKVTQTRDLIRKWISEDSATKIVIFTQFRAMAAIFSGMCKQENWAHTMLTGDMSFASRQQSIDDFQQKPEFPIMIASLKTGGIGLDLTSGNKCILVEPWWNDAIQQQAFCRLFRIGQHRNVEIVKLVTQDTIDDYMVGLQKLKLQEIEEAIEDATLPLSGVYGVLMNELADVQMAEDGGYVLNRRGE